MIKGDGEMNNVEYLQKTRLHIGLICILISLGAVIVTTPLHKVLHWVMSEVDPYIEPIEMHLFDGTSFKSGEQEHVLSSALGCVIVKEKYPGAFNDRPIWADTAQEIICCYNQIVIAIFICMEAIPYLKRRYLSFFIY